MISSLELSLPEIIYLFGTFHGVFLATILFLSKRSHRGSIYLASLILLFSFYLFENVLYSSGYIRYLPQFFYTTFPLIFLIGPLFYFYVRKMTDNHFKLRMIHGVHLLPFFAEVLLLLPFYRLDGDTKLKIYEASVANTSDWTFNIYFLGYLLYVLSACAYFMVSYRMTRLPLKHSHQNQVNWLRQSSLALMSYIIVGLILTLYLFVDGSVKDIVFHSNLLLQTLLIQLVGYTAFVKPHVFQVEKLAKKYQYSSLDERLMQEYKLRLTELMELEKPYLNPNVSADYFTKKLGISKHHFSQLLTEGLETNFYDYVNAYRVRKAQQLLLEPGHQNAKIIHIAIDSGFLHKSTFLRSFKRITGKTPTAFKKELEKESHSIE